MDKRSLIADLVSKRSAEREKLDGILSEARGADNALTDEQRASFDAGEAEIRSLDERIAELDAQVRADEAAAEMAKRYAPKASVTSVNEPEIYRSGLGGQSYFRDMWNARQNGDAQAMDRLQRNNRGRAAEQRALTTVNGAGGEFVPPLWLEKEFVRLARPGRITGNLVPTQALPAGTDSINVPKVNTGTAVAVQGTQNTAVQQTDLTTTSISSSVTTIAGGQTVSLQLIEQSPLNVDDVILADLAAAYAQQYNSLILSGSGTGGNPTGILTLSGTNAITYTSASPTVALLYSQIANAIQTVHTNRFLPPDTIIMHPRRWAYLLAASDSTGRPLVTPSANSPMNALANQGEVASQGFVGTIQGLPVYVDSLLPTNLGAGTNQDPIIVARLADLMAWEGNVKAEAFPQTYANQLSVFVRLYNYMSFQPARYPKSISVINGTGLVAPTF
ncbi:phage major capsid protein [Streptomyces sp. WI03-4A]|uniref:phage major capsid protein n=1 Tax=Streptomyces sp. WI03-4A TaxID=3028706 RepID=UPI0029BAD39F|nr:phage major capsid protein [Streptomyces sp. WI03-4A]MDX2590990.1 phage major capsid protein [Streptomyces sp. WI03-4A]